MKISLKELYKCIYMIIYGYWILHGKESQAHLLWSKH